MKIKSLLWLALLLVSACDQAPAPPESFAGLGDRKSVV